MFIGYALHITSKHSKRLFYFRDYFATRGIHTRWLLCNQAQDNGHNSGQGEATISNKESAKKAEKWVVQKRAYLDVVLFLIIIITILNPRLAPWLLWDCCLLTPPFLTISQINTTATRRRRKSFSPSSSSCTSSPTNIIHLRVCCDRSAQQIEVNTGDNVNNRWN